MGFGGRYWNVGLSDPGRLNATKRQLFFLRWLTKVDHRGKGLTRDAASDLIDKALTEREERRGDVTQVQDQMYATLVKSAARAANAAGEKWLAEHPEPVFFIYDPKSKESVGVHGRVGSAHISWPPKGNFHKWLRQNLHEGHTKSIQIPHHFSERLEADLRLAAESAAYEVLRSAGNTAGIRLILTLERGEKPAGLRAVAASIGT
jgi:hypothetical protein